jgi:NAD(P) transhydrogenase subunit beta
MSSNTTSLLYLVAAVLFILALRGLSSPVTSRRGNQFGMIGMAIAVVATLGRHGMMQEGYAWIIAGILIGGSIGAYVARSIAMTALPQLVAAFHSLVGLAAVFVAAGALNAPEAFGIGSPHHIHTQSLIEMSLGLAIGAITFTGSLIAFAKLQALMKGTPITFKGQHQLNLGLGILIFALIIAFVSHGGPQNVFWFIAILSMALGFLLIIPIGGADMPVVVSMLNSYSGWAACGIGFTIQNLALIITGALVGASGAILSYVMCKGMNRSIFNVLLGGFGTDSGSGPAHAGAADRTRNGRQTKGRRCRRPLRHPPRRRTHARPHERAPRRSQRPLRRRLRTRADQQRIQHRRRRLRHRRQRRHQSRRQNRHQLGHLRHAHPRR